MKMSSGSTIPTAEDREAPSTERGHAPVIMSISPPVGTTVLAQIDPEVFRPLVVTRCTVQPSGQVWVSGVILCDPADHVAAAFRHVYDVRADVGSFSGRPGASCPLGYGTDLRYGSQPGEWRFR